MTATRTETVSIRLANAADARAVRELAVLDSSPAPAEPVVVAEVNGRPRAALSLADGASVADPFFPSARLVALLRVHSEQLSLAGPGPGASWSHAPANRWRRALRRPATRPGVA